MAEIAPDKKKQNQQGIKPRFRGIWNSLTAIVEKDRIHDITEEMNRRADWCCSDGDTWLLPERSC